MKRFLSAVSGSLVSACILSAPASAQTLSAPKTPIVPDTKPATPLLPATAPSGKPVVSFMLRNRGNALQWFGATPNAETYAYGETMLRVAIAQRIKRIDWQLEMGTNAQLELPTDAISPIAAQGQLGSGATYYAANSFNSYPAAVSFRTGFLRYHFKQDKGLARIGRIEFTDGAETTPKNPAMAWVQTNRVAQRLIANFGFNNAQRSLDGVDFKVGGNNWDVTGMGSRVVEGVFKMAQNEELNVDVQYLAYSRYLSRQRILLRGFGLGYHDGRTGILKVDNRTAAARALDRKNIRLGMFGGDMIAAFPVHRQTLDVMVWGVGQTGSWGVLDHRAGAFAVETGLRFDTVPSKPWLRGGITRSTGDNNNTDGVHNTYFQVLPSPRQYARYPYFNMMNTQDEFVQIIDKPASRVELRSDLHFLQLSAPGDLWYGSGGPYDNKSFGYTGRPSNNHSSFSSLYDISADVALTRQLTMTAYYGHAFGRTVIQSIYPAHKNANYGYIELLYHLSKPWK